MPDTRESFVSVVLSFYNEEPVLPALLERLRKTFAALLKAQSISGYELIFVNDASTDRSETILKEASVGHNDIRIITMSRNFGISECVFAGLEYASGDVIIYMDADLQDPPEIIPSMIDAWKNGDNVDVVHTVRESRAGESLVKMFITKIGYNILHRVTDIKLPIEVGDFKLLSRRAKDYLLQLKEQKPFMRGLVCWIGFTQVSVKYHRDPRFSGKTKFKIFDSRVFWNFFESALISFSSMPLKVMIILGVAISGSAFIVLIYVIIQKFVVPGVTQGWSTLMATMLLLGGIQLLSLGVIGSYLNIVFLEAKGRPRHIIKEVFGFTADLAPIANSHEK
jgi:glycosyltransferase involved in cell wall biosynthesis